MKLRTSFFDRTAFRKDVTRFAPSWGLYSVGLLLIFTVLMAEEPGYYRANSLVNVMNEKTLAKELDVIRANLENKTKDWMNVRQQVYVVLFFRDNQNIEDAILRKMLEEMKKQNVTKCIICTSSGFTRQSLEFAENRPFELINKDKLEDILSKITL